MSSLRAVRFSILDRSRVRQGQSHPAALRETVEFARLAERWGYHRFWVSEHHSVPGVAGSAPTVLAAAVAAATSRIRVGTGGVMLPNHQPLVVAEQFGVLESLFPGRIDMGLGRSVGFTGGVRRALGHDTGDADAFDAQLAELLDYLARGRDGVHAWPTEGLPIPAYLLATGSGAQRASRFGLPLVIAAVRGEDAMVEAIERYREEFRPTPWGAAPYVMVSSTVLIADSDAEAARLLIPEAWAAAYSRTRGEFPVLVPPETVRPAEMSARERRIFDESLRGHIHGTEDAVAEALERLIARTGADEILVHTSTFDRDPRLESHARLARLAALTPQPVG
ncbi:LLM class flavin-dependent oxidoreductase [Nocardia sp. CDC159]|uniref:LLM class flavin-dependent oxidoreductase n=1 Tax=Nocardia pulmonis TaxID=2951408 RepID=A0A9X2IZ48_9NOCA|nr:MULTISPECIES: LLM class flavin-dependent oxidoreductase [Nocardia]MCM6777697.1 LLM class flavin-dependent oxidoreductase [Nocardia pulmonis]MCM6790499.1 LLM class flavin-dependent oxidoreductase [Nocardia sp. CDC159]